MSLVMQNTKVYVCGFDRNVVQLFNASSLPVTSTCCIEQTKPLLLYMQDN